MPLYIVILGKHSNKLFTVYCLPSRDMGALVRGARALCAYPSREELRVKS